MWPLCFWLPGAYAAAATPVAALFSIIAYFLGSGPVRAKADTETKNITAAEKDVKLPGYPNAVKLNQSWWCGYGPTDNPSIVVCAVIENGGHGGTAAAPAALKVFETYLKKHGVTTTHLSD